MGPKADFDVPAAHKYFAAHCFNESWALMDKPTRSIEEAEQLIALGQASLWHWTQRADCTATNLSIAHWLLSRIYAVLGDATLAQRYAGSCLRESEKPGVAVLYLGFAHEALARAAMLERDWKVVSDYLQKADELAAAVPDEGERKLLKDDLDTIRDMLGAAENEHS